MISVDATKEFWHSKKFADRSARGVLIRSALFLLLYTVLGLLYTPISSKMYNYAFVLYNKTEALFIYPFFVFFLLFSWQKIKAIGPYKNTFSQTVIFFAMSLICVFFPVSGLAGAYPHIKMLLFFIIFFFGFVSLFISVFNFRFLGIFSREISALIVAYVVFLLISYLDNTNRLFIFSNFIADSLRHLLSFLSIPSEFNSTSAVLQVLDFKVIIGPTCAGLYSVVTFVMLGLISLFLAKRNYVVRWGRSIFALCVGAIFAFMLNICRIGIIMLVGAYYTPKLALGLFHEYLGSVFLIILFVVYLLWVMPKWLITKKARHNQRAFGFLISIALTHFFCFV